MVTLLSDIVLEIGTLAWCIKCTYSGMPCNQSLLFNDKSLLPPDACLGS